jgi:hypothetical protein
MKISSFFQIKSKPISFTFPNHQNENPPLSPSSIPNNENPSQSPLQIQSEFPLEISNGLIQYNPTYINESSPSEIKEFYLTSPTTSNNINPIDYKTKCINYFSFIKKEKNQTRKTNPLYKLWKMIYIHNSFYPLKKIGDKTVTKINPKNPFKKDEYVLDYDKDSEEEYMEENAEDLKSQDGSSEEDEEEESADVNEKWIVPDGHFSDEEMSNNKVFEDRELYEKSKDKRKGVMDLLEIRKNFAKPVVVSFNKRNKLNVNEKLLKDKLTIQIFTHVSNEEDNMNYHKEGDNDIMMLNEDGVINGNNNNNLQINNFPIKIQRKKNKVTGFQNVIKDHLEDIIKTIHGSFQTKEQMIIVLNEKFTDIPKKTLDNFFKEKCLKIKHSTNMKKYWLVKHEILSELNLSNEEITKVLEDNYKIFEEKEKQRIEELEVNKQKNAMDVQPVVSDKVANDGDGDNNNNINDKENEGKGNEVQEEGKKQKIKRLKKKKESDNKDNVNGEEVKKEKKKKEVTKHKDDENGNNNNNEKVKQKKRKSKTENKDENEDKDKEKGNEKEKDSNEGKKESKRKSKKKKDDEECLDQKKSGSSKKQSKSQSESQKITSILTFLNKNQESQGDNNNNAMTQ